MVEPKSAFFLHYIISRLHAFLDGTPGVDLAWLALGLVGQSLFMMRFVVQWLHSERHKQSMIPVSFWYLSLSGGLMVLLYGIHRRDPVIILGQLPGTFVYLRNLALIRRNENK